MYRPFIISVVLILISISLRSQGLTQTVRGTVTDADSQSPLADVQVTLSGSSPLIGVYTNSDGTFVLENIPIGRITLQFSLIGYRTQTVSDLLVQSGKETIIQTSMQESVLQLDVILITPPDSRGEALNEMTLISARSISSNATNRFAGGFNDPARILSNFAGVNNSQDGSADIIVRGNSPKYIQWRLEGVPISNPSHFGDPAGLGTGAPSALNNHILATSDFHTGAFNAEFGDVLSGVYDIRLRTGNNQQFEAMAGLGILGTDITLEGPFTKSYGGSYLVNYRYSTISLIDGIGLVDIGGVPTFQDGAFKVVLPAAKLGTFSLFGLSGYSTLDFENVDPTIFATPGDRGLRADIQEDYRKRAHLFNTGINHMLSPGRNSYLKTTLACSGEGIRDNILETSTVNDSVLYARDNFKSRISSATWRASMLYNHKLSTRNTVQLGANYTLFTHTMDISRLRDDTDQRISLTNMDANIGTLRNFVSWKHRIHDDLTIVAGLHNMNVFFNNKSTLEPRIAASRAVGGTHSFRLGYGMHSTMERIYHYFARVEMPDGSIPEPNRDLELLRAHHFVAGYKKQLTRNLSAKIEAYYQHLYNLPVENSDSSIYATINETLDIRFADLVNKGTGRNYGLELTLERFFANNYYYMINASVFESKYTPLDGIERNTAFNSNYLINILAGKEFHNLGRNKNRTFSVNGKVFFGGGRRMIPLLRDSQGALAVDPSANSYWDYSRAYQSALGNIYTVSLALSHKWNKPKVSHELFINLDNLTNNQAKLTEYYAPGEPGGIGYRTTFGLFPNMMYRIYF